MKKILTDEYFGSIAAKLSERNQSDTNVTDSKFVEKRFTHSFELIEFIPAEISRAIEGFSNSDSCGTNAVTTPIVKDNRVTLANPLSSMICLSVHQGMFPDSLKTAIVVSVFKNKLLTFWKNNMDSFPRFFQEVHRDALVDEVAEIVNYLKKGYKVYAVYGDLANIFNTVLTMRFCFKPLENCGFKFFVSDWRKT